MSEHKERAKWIRFDKAIFEEAMDIIKYLHDEQRHNSADQSAVEFGTDYVFTDWYTHTLLNFNLWLDFKRITSNLYYKAQNPET